MTVIDAPGGAGNLRNMPEARQQVALADRIVLSKSDCADTEAVATLTECIREWSAARSRSPSTGEIDPSFLLDEAPDLAARIAAHDHDHDHAHAPYARDRQLRAVFRAALPWPVFEQSMAVLTGLRGPDLLRVKGLVAVEGCRGRSLSMPYSMSRTARWNLKTGPTAIAARAWFSSRATCRAMLSRACSRRYPQRLASVSRKSRSETTSLPFGSNHPLRTKDGARWHGPQADSRPRSSGSELFTAAQRLWLSAMMTRVAEQSQTPVLPQAPHCRPRTSMPRN